MTTYTYTGVMKTTVTFGFDTTSFTGRIFDVSEAAPFTVNPVFSFACESYPVAACGVISASLPFTGGGAGGFSFVNGQITNWSINTGHGGCQLSGTINTFFTCGFRSDPGRDELVQICGSGCGGHIPITISSYGRWEVVAVPGPVVGADLPGLLLAAFIIFGGFFWKRATEFNTGERDNG